MGKVRNGKWVWIRYCKHNGIPQYGEYRLFGKKMKYVRFALTVNNNAVTRLKRVVKGRHWRKNRRTKIYIHFKSYYKCYTL